MAKEEDTALIEWNPQIGGIIRQRGLFGSAPRAMMQVMRPAQPCDWFPAPHCAPPRSMCRLGSYVCAVEDLAARFSDLQEHRRLLERYGLEAAARQGPPARH